MEGVQGETDELLSIGTKKRMNGTIRYRLGLRKDEQIASGLLN